MSLVTWTVTDVEDGIDLADWSVGPRDCEGLSGDWSVSKRRLVGGKSDGVSVIEVDNGAFRFTVLPTRGMGVWRGWCGDRMLGWQSPVKGPVHPKYVPISEPSGLGWLDGFDELLVRCGLESNGPPEFDDRGVLRYPLHGRIANLPAHRVTVTADANEQTISVVGVVAECRFLFCNLQLVSTITTSIGDTGFRVHDVVENRGAAVAGFQMLYHINVGDPVLGAGSELVVPARQIVPRDDAAAQNVAAWNRYEKPRAGFAEQVYYFDLAASAEGQTQVLLKGVDGTEGVALEFNRKQLPCFIQWKNTAAPEDGYVTGLEPATNFPNPRSFEEKQGRVVSLKPGESRELSLALRWLRNPDDVELADRGIARLQTGSEPKVYEQPQPGWCAGS